MDLFIAKDGIIRVGGRLKKTIYNKNTPHTIVIHPKDAFTSKRILEWYCSSGVHPFRGLILTQIRNSGFWKICGNSFTRRVSNCRSHRGKFTIQKMIERPRRRVTDSSLSTFCGLDMFGPFIIKEGSKKVRKYGATFTCLSSSAVHIEITNSLETFTLALRRFLARLSNRNK